MLSLRGLSPKGELVGEAQDTAPPVDPETMAAEWWSLIETGSEGRRALRQKARKRVEANFHLASIVSAYESQYMNVARGAKDEGEGALAI